MFGMQFVINTQKDVYRIVEKEINTVSLHSYTQCLDDGWWWLVVEDHGSLDTKLCAQ